MCTYSLPLVGKDGKVVASPVIGADLVGYRTTLDILLSK